MNTLARIAEKTQTQDLAKQLRPAIKIGAVVVIGFFGVFGAWATFAPLSSAALAPGRVSPEGSRKVVQHLEGGIIADILAKDGDRVEAGQTLLQLQQTQSLANYRELENERATLTAMQTRLVAEQRGAEQLIFPDWLAEQAQRQEGVRIMLDSQQALFQNRAHTFHKQIDILTARREQLATEITGLKQQIRSQRRQGALLSEEIDDVSMLLAEGLARRPRLLELQRGKEQVDERIAANQARIAQAQQQIGEAELELAAFTSNYQGQIGEEVVRVTSQLAALNERLSASGDVLERTQITAPASGTVLASRFKSVGGVIAPGEAILEIVPDKEELIIEAQVSPMDIDVVQPGLSAHVRFPALAQRRLPQLQGEVITVSADAVFDDKTGISYFTAQVRVGEKARQRLGKGTLAPGMNADVQIVTGSRTPLQYFLDPMLGAFSKAFKES